jgi:hypothetical protein
VKWPWKPKLGARLTLPKPNVRAIRRSAALPVDGNGHPASPKMLVFREFLNSDEGSAFVLVDSEDLKLADCSRIITLDLEIWADDPAALAKSFRRKQEKLNRILRAVRVASDNLCMRYNWYLARIESDARKEAAKKAAK